MASSCLPFKVRILVKLVIPHFPTEAADLAADGLLVFSLKRVSKWKLWWLAPLLYLLKPLDMFGLVEISLIVGGKLNSSSPPETWQTVQKLLNSSGLSVFDLKSLSAWVISSYN